MKVGDICKYLPTSTVGKVIEVRESNGKEWALLDFTGLYYDVAFLSAADPSEYKEVSFKDRAIGLKQGEESDLEFDNATQNVNIDAFMPSGGG